MEKVILEALNKRYATKQFNPDKKLSDSQIETVLEAGRLTATSYGLQLMKIVVVESAEKREALLPYSFAQRQVLDASHLLVLCREKVVEPAHVEAYTENISNTREIPSENLDGFKNMMIGSIEGMSKEACETWMDKQVYIALGNLLNTCALLEIAKKFGFGEELPDQVRGIIQGYLEEQDAKPLMPFSLGDSGKSFLMVTATQYFMLQQWDAGKCVKLDQPRLTAGEELDRTILMNCLTML